MALPSVKNLIFDLGGVILDLSVDHTIRSFSKLSSIPHPEVKRIFVETPEFEDYEKGLLDDRQFRDFVRKVYSLDATDEEIDASWNAMLRGIPLEKLELLLDLKKKYRVFLLSNTNGIHLDYINGVLMKHLNGNPLLDDYFHKAYYSHRMLKRKPEAEIFEQVLQENNLRPGETLFMDDNILNVEGARGLGIQTIFITNPDHILEIFHE